ncbi:hypothetical protein HDU67_004675, partial [Dinochytrium kinnereticum]
MTGGDVGGGGVDPYLYGWGGAAPTAATATTTTTRTGTTTGDGEGAWVVWGGCCFGFEMTEEKNLREYYARLDAMLPSSASAFSSEHHASSASSSS